MLVKLLAALVLAFLAAAGFGKRYVPWLEKKNARQPLKAEVAKIYEDQTGEDPEEQPR